MGVEEAVGIRGNAQFGAAPVLFDDLQNGRQETGNEALIAAIAEVLTDGMDEPERGVGGGVVVAGAILGQLRRHEAVAQHGGEMSQDLTGFVQPAGDEQQAGECDHGIAS